MRSRPANVHVIGAHDDALSGPAWARFKRPRLSGPPAPPLLATTEDESSASCSPPSTPMSPVVDTHQCGLLASFADEATRPSPATEAATLANARTPCGRLPPELLLHVFSFVEPLDEDRLDRARFTRVCRAWTPPAVMTCVSVVVPQAPTEADLSFDSQTLPRHFPHDEGGRVELLPGYRAPP